MTTVPIRTASTSSFVFYDIESLTNVFTVCAYTQNASGQTNIAVYYLLDDDDSCGPVQNNLIDQAVLRQTMMASNPALDPSSTQVFVHDLRSCEVITGLAWLMGVCDASHIGDPHDRGSFPPQFRLVCDTDSSYDPSHHPFLAGYNSSNYDTTMLALFFDEVFAHDQAGGGLSVRSTTARTMRIHNDKLFSDQYIDSMPGYLPRGSRTATIRRAMIQSGRHCDVACLNESQRHVSLKRLLGMLGYQIKESSKLSHGTTVATMQEFYDLVAYNVSDCLGLSQLFRHPTYSGAFDLKAGLLSQYRETVFARDGSVRPDRLTIDSSSAKFVGRILAPYKPLDDLEAVSFVYPHPEVAQQRRDAGENIQSVNVLDECEKFFLTQVAPDPDHNPNHRQAIDQFMNVVQYYRSIEGKNFNDSEQYKKRYHIVDVRNLPALVVKDYSAPDGQSLPALVLRDIPKLPTTVFYVDQDGRPTSCFATFSTGGIHGAEFNYALFETRQREYVEQKRQRVIARLVYPDARDCRAEAKRQHGLLTLPDGSHVMKSAVIYHGAYRKPVPGDPDQCEQLARAQAQVPDPAELCATQRPESRQWDVELTREQREMVAKLMASVDPDLVFDPSEPVILQGRTVFADTTVANASYKDVDHDAVPSPFVVNDDGSTKLDPRYTFTSCGTVVHEDFTSYYPNLLRNMRAFYNPDLGEDRYAQIFADKQRYGREMKRPDISPEEKAHLSMLRNGTKLILNSASGAGDASFYSPIRMNNRIISMRIIGQLLLWRIGQAQTLAGGLMSSTNTDGLYSLLHDVLDEQTNNAVLADEAQDIGIEIEPDLMFLVSKDSNNRLELSAPHNESTCGDIRGASGGTLACWQGPSPTKALSHPAAIDYGLARYLQTVTQDGPDGLVRPFDDHLGRALLTELVESCPGWEVLRFFQTIVAASRGSITYPFLADLADPRVADVVYDAFGHVTSLVNPTPIPMINRVFVVKPGTAGARHMVAAGAWVVSATSRTKRCDSDGAWQTRCDPMALSVLRHHGWVRTRAEMTTMDGLRMVPSDQDVTVRRVTRIDPAWPVLIVNDDLHMLSRTRLTSIIDALDMDVYVSMLGDTFSRNWRNIPPGESLSSPIVNLDSHVSVQERFDNE